MTIIYTFPLSSLFHSYKIFLKFIVINFSLSITFFFLLKRNLCFYNNDIRKKKKKTVILFKYCAKYVEFINFVDHIRIEKTEAQFVTIATDTKPDRWTLHPVYKSTPDFS